MNSRLRQELFIFLILGSLILLNLFISPPLFDSLPQMRQRLLLSLLAWALIWQQLWQNRFHNRSARNAPLLTSLGWANRLTLLRGGLLAACAGFLFQPEPAGTAAFLPAVFYTLAALADRFDGALARRLGSTTLLGTRLDMSYDAIGLVIAPMLAIQYGKILPSYLLVSAAYYLFQFGLRWRVQRNLPVKPLMPSALRRTLAGVQMGFVATALWPPMQPLLTQITGVGFMVPMLLGFWIDWLVVSARLDADDAGVKAMFTQLASLTSNWLLPVLRAVLMAAVWFSLQPVDFLQITAIEWALLLTAIGILCGSAGRLCAMALLLLLNFYEGYDFVSAAAVTTQLAAVAIILFGTGRFSLWQRDGDWLTRQGTA